MRKKTSSAGLKKSDGDRRPKVDERENGVSKALGPFEITPSV